MPRAREYESLDAAERSRSSDGESFNDRDSELAFDSDDSGTYKPFKQHSGSLFLPGPSEPPRLRPPRAPDHLINSVGTPKRRPPTQPMFNERQRQTPVDKIVDIPDDEALGDTSLYFVSSGFAFIWCLVVLLVMIAAIALNVQQSMDGFGDDAADRTVSVVAWALLIVGSLLLFLVICILRGRDKVSVYQPSILVGLFLASCFYVSALALHLPLHKNAPSGLVISSLVVEIIGTLFLLLLVGVILLGVKKIHRGDVTPLQINGTAFDEEELEAAHRIIEQREEEIKKLKSNTGKDVEIIVDLQHQVKKAKRKEEVYKEREKEADQRMEKLSRKGGRLVTLRQKVQSLQDENHAYQAELVALQHTSNQQQASVEADISRLITKCKKLGASNKKLESELETSQSNGGRLREELEEARTKLRAHAGELEELQLKQVVREVAPVVMTPAADCINCKVWEAKHQHLAKAQIDGMKSSERLERAQEEVEALRRRGRDLEDTIRRHEGSDKEKELLASKLLDLKQSHAQCYDVANESKRHFENHKNAQAEVTVLQRKMDQAELKIEDLTTKKIILEKEHEALKGEVVGLNRSLQFMQDTKRGEEEIKNHALDDLRTKEGHLQVDLAELQTKFTQAQADLRDLERKNGVLDGRCGEMQKKGDTQDGLLRHGAERDAKCAELVAENKQLGQELDTARQHCDVAKKELARTKKVLYKKMASLREEIVGLDKELGHLKGDTQLRQQLVQDARARFARLKPLIGVEFTTGEGTGVRVTDVFPGKPADVGGLKVGDVVESVNGDDTLSKAQFHAVVSQIYPGDGVPFQINRDGLIETRVVHLGSPGLTLEEILAIRRVAHGIVHEEDLLAYKAAPN